MKKSEFTNFLLSKTLYEVGIDYNTDVFWISCKKMGTRLYKKNLINFRYECICGSGSFINQELLANHMYLFEIYKSYPIKELICNLLKLDLTEMTLEQSNQIQAIIKELLLTK